MRAFTYAASVSTGIWKPQNDFALHPISVSAIASSPIVTCSPVAATTSSSRSLGKSEIWLRQPEQPVRLAGHRGDDHDDVVPLLLRPRHPLRDVLDLLDGADRGPAVLLDNECHIARHPLGWKRMDRARKSSNLGWSGAAIAISLRSPPEIVNVTRMQSIGNSSSIFSAHSTRQTPSPDRSSRIPISSASRAPERR